MIGDNEEDEKIKRKPIQFSEGFSHFLSAVSYNNSQARRFLGEMSYIGPIREKPHRIYEITNETYYTVGAMGENMPNLLKKIGDKSKELNRWIKEFGFGDSIQLKHHYSNSYSIRFKWKDSDFYTSIANAGFGVSQVMPLVVQSIISPKRRITIAEQPEIHLNPKIQCVLAELFVSMANKGQSIIAETHSEHLLLRLRRLVADGTISNEDVAVYFVDKSKDDNKSVIREINIESDGHIIDEEWPKDFFDDSLKEAMALATAQFNRK